MREALRQVRRLLAREAQRLADGGVAELGGRAKRGRWPGRPPLIDTSAVACMVNPLVRKPEPLINAGVVAMCHARRRSFVQRVQPGDTLRASLDRFVDAFRADTLLAAPAIQVDAQARLDAAASMAGDLGVAIHEVDQVLDSHATTVLEALASRVQAFLCTRGRDPFSTLIRPGRIAYARSSARTRPSMEGLGSPSSGRPHSHSFPRSGPGETYMDCKLGVLMEATKRSLSHLVCGMCAVPRNASAHLDFGVRDDCVVLGRGSAEVVLTAVHVRLLQRGVVGVKCIAS